MFMPISSTNTTHRASRVPATITFQAALRNSSRSSAPRLLFFERSPSSSLGALQWSRYKGRARYVLQETTSLADGGGGALLYVFL